MRNVDLIPADDNLASERPALEERAGAEVILDELQLSLMALGADLLDATDAKSVDRVDAAANQVLEMHGAHFYCALAAVPPGMRSTTCVRSHFSARIKRGSDSQSTGNSIKCPSCENLSRERFTDPSGIGRTRAATASSGLAVAYLHDDAVHASALAAVPIAQHESRRGLTMARGVVHIFCH